MNRLTLLAFFCAASGWADVRLPAIISDHMVIQAETPVAIWGWAEKDESVVVSLGGKSVETKAEADGCWSVKIGPFAWQDQGQVLTIKGRNTLTIQDVLVGEVWLASGQSNMEMQIKDPQHGSIDHADEEVAAAQYPQIRMFKQKESYSIYEVPTPPDEPVADREGAWIVCSPETAASFSAFGYFVARDLHRALGAPVGIVSAAVGGTPIEAWTSLAAQKDLQPVLTDWAKKLQGYDAAKDQASFLEAKKQWLKVRAEATKAGLPVPKAPTPFKNLAVMKPGGLFNGVIAPLVPYTVRGVLWYQGERNAAGPLSGLYGAQLKALIGDWRARWGEEFPFAWVQLSGVQKMQETPMEANGWGVKVRDEMRRTLAVPKTSMAVTIDLGGVKAGHPTNKADFAARMSKVVLHDVYYQPIPIWTGPLFRSARRDGAKMVLSFDYATGLKTSRGELQGFAIAGADRKFQWAKARIEGNDVVVWSDALPEPASVRYAWASNPIGNLVNAADLPASPFRTDNWP